MKIAVFLLSAYAVWSQTAAPPVPPDVKPETVLATYGDGQKLTYDELRRFLQVLPPQMQQMAQRDRKAFVQQYALMKRLSALAEGNKLYEQSPTKEALEFNRMYVLMNAQLNDVMNHITVLNEDVEKYYQANQDRYRQARVKVIYVSFMAPGAVSTAKKALSEEEAKVKIEKIAAEARGGADFVKLVKQHSEDEASAAKDGDFGMIRRSDSIPEAIRTAVFALKPGQISEPIRQPNGFYLFRLDELSVRPLKELQEEIHTELRQQQFRAWMDGTNRGLNVKYEHAGFFEAKPQPPAAK